MVMLQKEDTKLEVFGFGQESEDNFYCLIDLTKSPDGLDVEKLSQTDPRKLDEVLEEMGCIVMLSGQDVEKLINEGDISSSDLHGEIFDLARKENLIS